MMMMMMMRRRRRRQRRGGGGGGGGNKGKNLWTRELVSTQISGPRYSSRLCIYLVIYCNIELDKSKVTYVTIWMYYK
jgi:hypothetical protein